MHANPDEWLLDLGATHHLPPSVDSLSTVNLYQGKSSVMVADGKMINIAHVGNVSLSNSSRLLHLDNVFHTP